MKINVLEIFEIKINSKQINMFSISGGKNDNEVWQNESGKCATNS